MAIFKWTATGKTLGSTPDEWISLKDLTSATITNDTFGDYVSLQFNGGTTGYAQFVPAGTENADVEIHILTSEAFTTLARCETANPNDNYVRPQRTGTEFKGDQKLNGSMSSIGLYSHAINFPELRWHVIQIVGDTWKYKTWLMGETKPADWRFQESTLVQLNTGAVGMYSFGGEAKVYEYEVRTGTDMEGYVEPVATLTPANPPQGGELFSFSGTNYTSQPTGPMTFTQGTRTVSRAVTISNWNATDGSFTGVTNTALPSVPAAGASDTPALLYGEPVTISLPDPGA